MTPYENPPGKRSHPILENDEEAGVHTIPVYNSFNKNCKTEHFALYLIRKKLINADIKSAKNHVHSLSVYWTMKTKTSDNMLITN